MFEKRIAVDTYTLGEPCAQIIKLAHDGLMRGNDLRGFLKRASHHVVDVLKKLAFSEGEIPIHLIAIGAGEFFGANRNGDWFSEQTCRDHHHTFVSKPVTKEGAYWYRSHQNKDPLQSYGIVKASMFNDAMKRIELIVALNGTKEAAERNHGLVAEDEMQKLASNQAIPVSMACLVDYDVCSGCSNRARNRSEYCDEMTCKYGGLKNNMSKIAEDGHMLYADNPSPRFFDISHVWRPADRIAHVLGRLDQLEVN